MEFYSLIRLWEGRGAQASAALISEEKASKFGPSGAPLPSPEAQMRSGPHAGKMYRNICNYSNSFALIKSIHARELINIARMAGGNQPQRASVRACKHAHAK